MGNGLSHLFPCFNPNNPGPDPNLSSPDPIPLDEALGHSFCYVRSSQRFLSPSPSDRFLSPSSSLRFSPPHRPPTADPTCFKSISGASVSANTSASKTVLQLDHHHHHHIHNNNDGACNNNKSLFESSSSFSSLPLQPLPRSGPGEPYFMSGPIERGALSGPLEQAHHVPFSAPLGVGGGVYANSNNNNNKKKKKKRRGGISGGIRRAVSRSFSEKKRPWVVPVRNFRKEEEEERESREEGDDNEEWALGAAGEDRVHVVVSEELGWLFVGIYDGFNGPDGPEFLMGNLYKSLYCQLEGLFWDNQENGSNCPQETVVGNEKNEENGDCAHGIVVDNEENGNVGIDRKRVTFEKEEVRVRRRRLWEYLAEDDREEEGLDLSGHDRYAFSVDDALSVGKEGSAVRRSSLLLSRLKHGLVRRKESGKLFAWRFKGKREERGSRAEVEEEEEREEEGEERVGGRKRKVGPVDHREVLRAMSRALEATEVAYLEMTDKFLDQNPELALMGSCLLVVLMREEDVYVMNVGDSRAIVAQFPQEEISTSRGSKGVSMDEASLGEDIVEEREKRRGGEREGPAQYVPLSALQLSTDHSTSIEEEIIRIKNEHPEDSHCIVNDRVKGKLKVTRAFGAGFLKQPKWNDALLEMFRYEYIGTAPYLSCLPSLRHHKLCPSDQFLVLSSDGLYQYFSNQEVVSEVENFMERFPDGDPAQHLIEELLLRAAKKAGMDLQELLDIPQGDRRKYHDDVTVMVVSLEGRIWKSSGKYL